MRRRGYRRAEAARGRSTQAIWWGGCEACGGRGGKLTPTGKVLSGFIEQVERTHPEQQSVNPGARTLSLPVRLGGLGQTLSLVRSPADRGVARRVAPNYFPRRRGFGACGASSRWSTGTTSIHCASPGCVKSTASDG